MFITSPEKFAAEFNQTVPGAYRNISSNDVRLLTDCGLIKHYGYYTQTDLHTVTGILQYEQLRDKRTGKEEKAVYGVRLCRGCGTTLSSQEVIYELNYLSCE